MNKLEENIIYVLDQMSNFQVDEIHYKKTGFSTNRMWQVQVTLTYLVTAEIAQVIVGDARYTRGLALMSLRDKVRYMIGNEIIAHDDTLNLEDKKRLLKLLEDV